MSTPDIVLLAIPLAALVAASVLLVPLGAAVLRRGVVFIDLAVAQMAACGVLVTGIWWEHPSPAIHALTAAGASLAGAAGVWWLARRWPEQREALIGLVYVAASSLAIVLATQDPHGRERLTALLAADVLWATPAGVYAMAAAATVVALALFARRTLLARDAVFYPVFAVAVSIAVPVLGLYVVFALLIGPGLWSRKGVSLAACVVYAVVACTLALAISALSDWPSGACVALALCALGCCAAARAAW